MGVIRLPWVSKEWFSQCPFDLKEFFPEEILEYEEYGYYEFRKY